MTNENPLKLYARAGVLRLAGSSVIAGEALPNLRDDAIVRVIDRSTPFESIVEYGTDGATASIDINIAKTLDAIEHGELISPPEITLLYQYIVDRNLLRFLVSNQYTTGKELIDAGLVDYSRLGCLA